MELVQEESSGESVLAVFESSVRDLLFPSPVERLSYSGMDLDLLMEPTRDFPVRYLCLLIIYIYILYILLIHIIHYILQNVII